MAKGKDGEEGIVVAEKDDIQVLKTQELYKKAKTSGLKLLQSYLQQTVLGRIVELWNIFCKGEAGLLSFKKKLSVREQCKECLMLRLMHSASKQMRIQISAVVNQYLL